MVFRRYWWCGLAIAALLLIPSMPAFSAGAAEEAEPTPEAPIELVFVHQHIPFSISSGEVFKEYAERESDGAIQVTLLHWEALGGDREVVEQLEVGDIHVTQATTGGLAGLWPDVQVYGWPFLFEDRYIAWKILDDEEHLSFMRDELLEASGGTIRLFGGAENAIRHLYTSRGPIRTPDDMEAARITMRTRAAPFDTTLWEALGVVSTVDIPAAERYTAFQTGMVHAAEGGPASNWEAGIMEVADYMTLTGHAFAHHFYIINEQFYQSLPAHLQRVIDGAMEEAITHQNREAEVQNEEAVGIIRDAGNTVYEPTPEEIAQWRDRAMPVAEEFLGPALSSHVVEHVFDTLDRLRAER